MYPTKCSKRGTGCPCRNQLTSVNNPKIRFFRYHLRAVSHIPIRAHHGPILPPPDTLSGITCKKPYTSAHFFKNRVFLRDPAKRGNLLRAVKRSWTLLGGKTQGARRYRRGTDKRRGFLGILGLNKKKDFKRYNFGISLHPRLLPPR